MLAIASQSASVLGARRPNSALTQVTRCSCLIFLSSRGPGMAGGLVGGTAAADARALRVRGAMF
ncbi:hypothetical protein BC834DRAFT_472210 [Gloeopeniophorella convolvens]|nr:hypothetical protein BC834DRAFT_472210 [Gloeopeniophorella convolvens]